ncbi:MAG: ankyrin repeat domain-containing protein [Pyrinomonadaceae bacterium]
MTLRRLFLLLFTMLSPLVAVGQNPKQELNDQMWEAARKGDTAAVTAALDKGAEVNAKFRYGTTALFKAAERGNTEVVKLLLARGADVTVKDTFYNTTAMRWALDGKHVEVVRALLEKDTTGVNDVLTTGTREGNVELVRAAIEKGGLKPETLTAALVLATGDEKKAEIAEMLKKAGAVPPPEIDAATLQSYVGKYKAEPGPEISITLKDGKLFAGPVGQPPIALMAVDKTNFKPAAFDGLITFAIEGGKAVGFALKQGANTMQLKRVEEK